ncbi:MAG: ABC transporter ATP-binding protein [Candidatus Lokiarchaeota archaeon]|nr:ABC transporter ATP-binding protein [Candidatus Lokiarchaeota archaeon]
MLKVKSMNINPNSLEIWSKELTKIYGKGEQKITAVDEINLFVKKGVHGFLGPNGAGKSSTINMLVGAISITNGQAKIKGNNAGSQDAKKFIGFLPQDPALYGRMTGEQYLQYFGRVSGFGKEKAIEKTKELLKQFNLTEAKNRKIKTYSRGMKQKIALASALIKEPHVLILDEPTSNLDPVGRAEIIKEIRALSKNICVFVSSHVLSEIEQMCDYITIINKGKIVLTNKIENIKETHSKANNVYILNTNSNKEALKLLENQEFIEKVWIDARGLNIHIIPSDTHTLKQKVPKILINNNILLEKFSQEEFTLEDIFLEMMNDNFRGI